MWLFSKKIDLFYLYTPIWVSWIICFLLPSSVLQIDLPLWAWVVIVLGIDVSHVWSTIFRTYTDKEEFLLHKKLLVISPFISFSFLFCLAYNFQAFFWSAMAYVALYHFIKQQFGFLMLYRAKAEEKKYKLLDTYVIYISMLWPILYWHLDHGRSFNWFAENDFLKISVSQYILNDILLYGNYLYWLIILGWSIHSIIKRHSPGKILWTFSTAINWWIGIVYFNSDVVFSITNVVAHGIPYMVLIIIYKQRKEQSLGKLKSNPNKIYTIFAMLSIVLLLAFFEEYLWDILINRDKKAFFGQLLYYPLQRNNSSFFQALAIALLSVPQMTHYIIDGFIWKKNKKNPYLRFLITS